MPSGRHLPANMPDGKCGARTRNGRTCRHDAGARTPHKGSGRCWKHGGLTPVKHGRYSSMKRESLRELIAQHEADPDPLNVLPELAACRALLQDFIDRYDEWREAILAWHASYSASAVPLSEERLMALERTLDEFEVLMRERGDPTEEQESNLRDARETVAKMRTAPTTKPRMILDVSAAWKIASEITQIVDRIKREQAANAVSRGEMLRIMTEMGRVVVLHVPDQKTREAIERDWLRIVRVA